MQINKNKYINHGLSRSSHGVDLLRDIVHKYRWLHKMTKKIVIFIAKYLYDYKNSHIFVLKENQANNPGMWWV
jgi:hypothetical protein